MNAQSIQLQNQLRAMSQAACNTSIEGIFNLDKFQEKKVAELMTRIHAIEDEVAKAA